MYSRERQKEINYIINQSSHGILFFKKLHKLSIYAICQLFEKKMNSSRFRFIPRVNI